MHPSSSSLYLFLDSSSALVGGGGGGEIESIKRESIMDHHCLSQETSTDDDACDTGLALGFGGRAASNHRRPPVQKQAPSLTLSLISEDDVQGGRDERSDGDQGAGRPSSPDHSAVSSFSTAYTTDPSSTVKKEKEEEEAEVERAGSRRGSEDDLDFGGRKKLRLTKEQSAMLEDRFREHSTLNPMQKHALAKQLNLRPRQVEVWFQNRRARTKLKQTEVDCEFLKRCCESLTDENRRLQKELQELKSLKFAPPPPPPPPVYMQFPAATLTMCPSCKAIGGTAAVVDSSGSSGSGGAESFVVAAAAAAAAAAPKPHFFNPFVHSATC